MTLPLTLGLLLVALGAAGLLAAWLHPSPNTLPIAKLLTWAPREHDRLNIGLISLSTLALGALFVLNTPDRGWLPLAVCGVVLVGAGIAIGVRR